MADNLTVSIGIDTKKLQADLVVAQSLYKKTLSELKKAGDEFAKTGDAARKARVDQLSAAADTLKRSMISTGATVTAANRAFALHAKASAEAAAGVSNLAHAHKRLAEESKGTSREVFKIASEFGKLETTGVGIAKMFREFPKVAIPVAVVAGVTAAARKLTTETYKSISGLDDLAKSSGFAVKDLIALRKVFGDADVGADALNKTIKSVGESFDKAKIKSGDFGSMLSGVQTLRGGTGSGETGVQILRPGVGPDGQPISTIEGRGRVMVQRGGAQFNIRPEEGFAGIVDPNQFRNGTEFFKAVREALLNLRSPLLQRSIIRGQGLEPGETLRALQQMSPDAWAEAMRDTVGAPGNRPGAIPLVRQFGAQAERAQRESEETRNKAGLIAMEPATKGAKALGDMLKWLGEQIDRVNEEWTKTMGALSKGPDSGELGASTEGFSAAWQAAIGAVTQSWAAARNYMSQPVLPGMGSSQEGQVIPIAPARPPDSGFATGGMVGGVGSGDTVPAWLTPGEYVNRRASVAYYGTELFRALNNRVIPRNLFSRIGYATGGLVGDLGQSFAEGGAVSGGANVHLHLGDQTYTTRATASVASALVVEARRQQMRSAGVKPSWFAGRPGA